MNSSKPYSLSLTQSVRFCLLRFSSVRRVLHPQTGSSVWPASTTCSSSPTPPSTSSSTPRSGRTSRSLSQSIAPGGELGCIFDSNDQFRIIQKCIPTFKFVEVRKLRIAFLANHRGCYRLITNLICDKRIFFFFNLVLFDKSHHFLTESLILLYI